jgi:aminopeptidase N
MALDTVKHALKIFNDSFGKYPYDELRIAEANYYCGGMEYPTFIMMNTGKYKEPNLSNTSLERSTAHEVAHQWWYGVVGNNQVRESWIDEGLTEFSTAYYFEKRYGEAGREAYFERYVDTARNIIQNSTMKMYDPLPQFKIRGEYFPVVYINGMLFYDSLRSQIDDEHFFYLLKTYYEKYKYKNVNMVQLIKFLKERTQDVLDDTFFEKWFSLE